MPFTFDIFLFLLNQQSHSLAAKEREDGLKLVDSYSRQLKHEGQVKSFVAFFQSSMHVLFLSCIYLKIGQPGQHKQPKDGREVILQQCQVISYKCVVVFLGALATKTGEHQIL